MERSLDPDQVKLVLRRAAELERRPGRDDEGLSADDVAEIGHDVGLTPDAVRRALDEVQAGVLPVEAPERSLTDRVLGPAEAVIDRVVPGPVDAVRAEVARFLEDQLMIVRRNLGDRTVWTRARGMWPAMRRALDLTARLQFAPGTEIEAIVAPAPGHEGAVHVRFVLSLDAARRRRRDRVLSAVLAGLGIAVVTIGTAHGLAPDLVGAGAGAALGGGAAAVARRNQRQDLRRAEDGLLRFLDALEHERG